MALSKGLEEELTCPIHLEYYEEPMILKCLHTLCKKDVDAMMKEKKYLTCPVCKSVSKRNDIKKDFRTQNLLDMINADQEKEKKSCQFCQEESAVKLCRECNMLFCLRCSKGHLRTPVSKHHHFEEVNNLLEERRKEVQRILVLTEGMTPHFSKAKEGWEAAKEENSQKLDQIESQIDRLEGIIMSKVRKMQERLRKDARKIFEKENERADELLHKATSGLEKFQKEINVLKDLMENEEMLLLEKEKCSFLVKESNSRSACINTVFLPLPVIETKVAFTWPTNEISKALKNFKITSNEFDRKTGKLWQKDGNDEFVSPEEMKLVQFSLEQHCLQEYEDKLSSLPDAYR